MLSSLYRCLASVISHLCITWWFFRLLLCLSFHLVAVNSTILYSIVPCKALFSPRWCMTKKVINLTLQVICCWQIEWVNNALLYMTKFLHLLLSSTFCAKNVQGKGHLAGQWKYISSYIFLIIAGTTPLQDMRLRLTC